LKGIGDGFQSKTFFEEKTFRFPFFYSIPSIESQVLKPLSESMTGHGRLSGSETSGAQVQIRSCFFLFLGFPAPNPPLVLETLFGPIPIQLERFYAADQPAADHLLPRLSTPPSNEPPPEKPKPSHAPIPPIFEIIK